MLSKPALVKNNIEGSGAKKDGNCSDETKSYENTQTSINSIQSGDVKIPMNGTKADLSADLAKQLASKKPDAGNRRLQFKEKEFKVRPSLLTLLYETEARVINNFLLSFFFLITCGVWIRDFYRSGNPLDHFWLISWNFAQLPQTVVSWALMFVSTIVFPYYGMVLWIKLPSESLHVFEKFVFGLTYTGYLFSLFYYSIKLIFYFQLNFACSMIITCENCRLAMKVHSFIRENFCRALQIKQNLALQSEKPNDSMSANWPTVQHYIYYSFCPSLLYRDFYPRVESRSWLLIAHYALQCLGTLYFLNIVIVLLVHPLISSFDYDHKIHWGDFAFAIFQLIPAGIVSMFAIFYGLLHSWMNMFAEGMRFGDRHYYSNWWKSKNMAEYYRSWNLIVHEWLYAYVYRDFTMILGTKWGPKVSQITVFFLSAAIHEYWFGVSLRMFYPVIFGLYFIAGGIFFQISSYFRQPQVWNTLMWFNLMIGTGAFFSTYGTEWYARQRCPRVYDNDFVDIIIPRIWSCMKA